MINKLYNQVSYGVVNFPRQDGYHKIEVETWSPMGDWKYSNFSFFLGTQPRLSNLDMTKYHEKRSEMLGVSNGKVMLEIEVNKIYILILFLINILEIFYFL